MLKAASILLILGTIFFWAGAFSPPYKQWSVEFHQYLEFIHQHPKAWIWINSAMAVGVLFTMFGLALLAQELVRQNEVVFSNLSLLAYIFGAVLWVSYLAYRITVEPWAASVTVQTGEIPGIIQALHRWTGLLFSIYMVLAYLATAGFGYSMLSTSLIPAWACWTAIIFGIMGALLFPARVIIFEPPLMIHLVPLIIAIVLLVKH